MGCGLTSAHFSAHFFGVAHSSKWVEEDICFSLYLSASKREVSNRLLRHLPFGRSVPARRNCIAPCCRPLSHWASCAQVESLVRDSGLPQAGRINYQEFVSLLRSAAAAGRPRASRGWTKAPVHQCMRVYGSVGSLESVGYALSSVVPIWKLSHQRF